MKRLAEGVYFLLCSALGRLLRSARYATAHVISVDDTLWVRKHRRFYAPLLVRMSVPLMTLLNTGVRVLPRRDWEARERQLYQRLRGAAIRRAGDGALLLPLLAGKTLAALLEDPRLTEQQRLRAIELAVRALAGFHHAGYSHGDAMADNVMVDLECGVAHWFDFETRHDANRPMHWRFADDLRALLASILVRTVRDNRPDTLAHMLHVYPEEQVKRALAVRFRPLQRALPFHLGQAGLTLRTYREIARLLLVPQLIPWRPTRLPSLSSK